MPSAMSQSERAFFRALGARIAEARKAQGMTQAELARELDAAQQVIASYEVGRYRIAASSLPRLAQVLAVPVAQLIGTPEASGRKASPKLLQQIERIERLPKAQRDFMVQVIDALLHQYKGKR